ncbi:MAG: hypothetical protein EAY81_01835, partial [Bacteroidetes bacterium]
MANDKLISADAIAKGLKLQKLKLSALAPFILKALKLEKVNTLYANHQQDTGAVFADEILKELRVDYEYNPEELNNIPKSEPFIVIANHPYGGIDGMMLLKIITQMRPDFKIMANFLLQQIPPLKDNFVSVNPFESV